MRKKEEVFMEEEALATISPLGHPWRRYFARHFDLSLYGLVWFIVQLFVLRWFWPDNVFFTILNGYIVLIWMMGLEPLLLKTLGTTPGKWIMGLELRTEEGRKPSVGRAFDRVFGVFANGMGFGLPIYELIRMWKNKGEVDAGVLMPWNEGWSYRLKDQRSLRLVAMALCYGLFFLSTFWVVFQAQLPPHRGELTPKEYAENINDLLDRPEREGFSHRMTEEGHWVRNQVTNQVTIQIRPENLPRHQMVVHEGVVTAVGFDVEAGDDDQWQSLYIQQKELMSLAFVGAQKEVTGFWLLFRSGLFDVLGSEASYTKEVAGVRVSHQLSYEGYRAVSGYLIPEEEKDHHMSLTFWLEEIE